MNQSQKEQYSFWLVFSCIINLVSTGKILFYQPKKLFIGGNYVYFKYRETLTKRIFSYLSMLDERIKIINYF